ncbi:MAG: hypothetical protein FJY65_04180 [Calditrichaeota bacterium]|nr:hypothetical protein [Calditrichota bacterium]
MIMSNKWMSAAYGEELRRFIKDYQIEKLVDFPRGGVFKGVGVSPAIMIAVNTKPQTEPLYARIQRPPEDVATLRKEIEQSGIAMHNGALAVNGFALVKKDVTDIFEKMKTAGAPLEEYVEKKIFRGLITGLNEAFIIDSRQREELIETDSKSEEIIVQVLKGEDVCKWKANYRNRYLILTKIGVDIDEYPGVFEYLQKFSPKIEKRLDQGKHWWELRACKYYESFITEKIIWPDISQTSRFAWDNEGYYCTNTAYFISTKNTILLSLLNSKLIWKWLSSKTAVLGDPDNRGGRRLFTQYIKKIPIFSPFDDNLIDKFIKLTHTSIDTQSKLNQSIGLAERRRLEKQLSEAEAEIDSLVYQLYGLTSQEIDIIERR